MIKRKQASRHQGIKASIWFLLVFQGAAFAGIANTKHNLSLTGPGTYKAASETRICVFCHVPHGANPSQPLWNHASTVQSFTPYDKSVSQTLKSNPGQPDGASKLCLGCHDGTVALGSTGSETIYVQGDKISGTSSLGTNLSSSHPVSFLYDETLAVQNGQLASPSTLVGAVRLDKNSKLQCTTCHDPHNDTSGKFLVMNNSGGNLCSVCHNKTGWQTAAHKTSPTMGGAACNACHKSHGVTAVPMLKKEGANLCFDCHGGGGPAPVNVQEKFSGTSNFAGAGSAGSYTTVNTRHDVLPADQTYSGAKLSCSNCHNPHAVKQKSNSGGAIETLVDPFNRNAVWTGGGATDYRGSITNFCLKCHSGNFPPSVLNPGQNISPSSVMINIGVAYQTDRHGSGSARPTSNNSLPAVTAMACTVCHDQHGSHYTDQAWDGNVYRFKDLVDGTGYADNGAEAGPPLKWPYVVPSSSTGVSKSVRVNPNKINTAGDANNLNNLCGACHSKTSGPAGASHASSFSNCTNCHHHGNPISAGGL